MKPYQNKKLPEPKTDFSAAIFLRAPERVLQIIALGAATWSILSFLFGVGFVCRIDPSLVQILTLSDIFGISLSYVIYLVPLGVLLIITPWQFFMPLSQVGSKGNIDIEFVPLHLLGKVKDGWYFYMILFVGVSMPALLFLDSYFHFIDHSSLFYMFGDTAILPLFMTLAILLAFERQTSSSNRKYKLLPFLGLSMVLSGSYLCGDYMSSLRMNSPSELDCAVLNNNFNRCTPILVWGSTYFITWSGSRMRAVPASRLDHIWLHPRKKPDPRRAP